MFQHLGGGRVVEQIGVEDFGEALAAEQQGVVMGAQQPQVSGVDVEEVIERRIQIVAGVAARCAPRVGLLVLHTPPWKPAAERVFEVISGKYHISP